MPQSDILEEIRSGVFDKLFKGKKLIEILESILRPIERENETMLCSILLLDEEGKHLLSTAAPRLPKFYVDAIHGGEIGLGVGSCGTAAYTGESVIVEDIQTHPYWENYKIL
ncbi:MAG: diguanylate cyclase, partial [Bacteroidetes bacterium HGW-Bacteroidetes-11]